MRGLPRRIMIRLTAPNMFGAVAALGTPLRGEGRAAPFYPPPLRAEAESAKA